MASAGIWNLGGLSWRSLGAKVWEGAREKNILGVAGELSYFLLLALFPLMLLFSIAFAALATEGSHFRGLLQAYASHVLPQSAAGVVGGVLNHLNAGDSQLLSVGILLLLWSASQGMTTLIRVLNETYGVTEVRSWWKRRLVGVGLTLLLMLFVLLALVTVIAGGWTASYISAHTGMAVVSYAWMLLRWPVVVSLAFLAFGWVYLLAPSYDDRAWYWVAPGALVAVAVWLAGSWLLKLYVAGVTSFSGMYGSVGAVMALMIWIYIMSLALVLGGQINIILETAAADHGDSRASKRRNQRAAVERGRAAQKNRQHEAGTPYRKAS